MVTARNNPMTHNMEVLFIMFCVVVLFGLLLICCCPELCQSWVDNFCYALLNENEPPPTPIAGRAGRQAEAPVIQQVDAESADWSNVVSSTQAGRNGTDRLSGAFGQMGSVGGGNQQPQSREYGNSRVGSSGAPRMTPTPRSLYQPPPMSSSSAAVAATHASTSARQNIIIGAESAELRSSSEGPNSSRQNQQRSSSREEADVLPSYDQFAPPTYHESLYMALQLHHWRAPTS